MTNQISFQASYIKPSEIRKCSPKAAPKDFVASFTELNPNTYNDKKTLKEVASLWDNGQTFATSIFDNFADEVYWENTNKKYYALTRQKKKFGKLAPDKILGLAEVIIGKSNLIKIKHIQTKPQDKFDSPGRNFKGIGNAMLDSLKTIFPKEDIVIEPVGAIEFYKKTDSKK